MHATTPDPIRPPDPAPPGVAPRVGVAELLEELLEQVTCDCCHEPISPFEMFVCWPVGGITAHINCFTPDNRT